MAEPRDLKIVCGEFNNGVEIVRNSFELEQVFNIKRIVNHPSYQPNRVGKPKPNVYFAINPLFLGRYC